MSNQLIKGSNAGAQQPDYLFKDILNMKEASVFSGLSKSSLYKMTMNREVQFSRPHGKLIYFRRKDLEDFLLSNVQKSKIQIEGEVDIHLTKKKSNA